MAAFQIEAGVAHGRGFSGADPTGFCAKLLSWIKRPVVDGSPAVCTANAGTDEITCTGHGYASGDEVRLTNAGGALPGGLALATSYYVILADANTFKLATTYRNAMVSVAIDILSAGTGIHSVYKLGGGAGWYLVDDLSRVTAKTFGTSDVNTSNEQITIAGHGFGTGHKIIFSSSGTVPAGLVAGTVYYAIRVDANTIKVASSYSASYNGTAINITSQGTGTHTVTPYEFYAVFCDTFAPTVNAINTSPSGGPPKFIKFGYHTNEAGRIRVQYLMWWNATTHFGYGYWAGWTIDTYDDADYAYDFRGGSECMFLQSRLGTSWWSTGIDEWVGDANLVEGTDKAGFLQSSVTAGSSVVLQLGSGEAANFTFDKYYYLFSFNSHTRVNYVRVTSVNLGTDQVTISQADNDFPAGSVLCAYAHRWAGFGMRTIQVNPNENFAYTSSGPNTNYTLKLPYCSYYSSGGTFTNQISQIFGTCAFEAARLYLLTMDPEDSGYYACMRPGLCEDKNEIDGSGGMNRAYGVLKNIYLTALGSMSKGQDGRTINGKNYLYFQTESYISSSGSSSIAVLFLDTESNS